MALKSQPKSISPILKMSEPYRRRSIVSGKKADFVLLGENPLKVNPLRLREIEILGTVFEGRPYPVLAGAIDFEVRLHVDKQG